MEFKKQMLSEELGLPKTGKKNFTNNKSQKVIVSEEQLERLLSRLSEGHHENMEEDAKPDFLDLDGDGDKEESMKKAAKDKKEMEETIVEPAEDAIPEPEGDDFMEEDPEAVLDMMEEENMDEMEEIDEEEYMGAPDKVEKRDVYDGRPGKVIGVYSNIKDQRKGMSETTQPITESEVRGISKFMERMNSTGKSYNPAPKSIKTRNDKTEELFEAVNKTYKSIRTCIIKERISSLETNDYKEVLSEQSFYGSGSNRRHPGESAAAGVENIINNIKRAYSYIKDSKTRKQIANTLTKLNNFMTYSAELIGSGRDQRAARSFEDVSNPLPYPEVEEDEELENIDDEITMTEDKDWMQDVDKDIEERGTEGVFHKWCVDKGFRNGCDRGCWYAADASGDETLRRRAGLAKAFCESKK